MHKSQLQNKSRSANYGVYFFGTNPPKINTPIDEVAGIADSLLLRLESLDYDGLIVYDIQDEGTRTSVPRPFPYCVRHDPRLYSQILHDKSGRSVITYKSVSQGNADDFSHWLSEAWHRYAVRDLVLVGSPSSQGEIKFSLTDAYKTLNAHTCDFYLGGVTIAERHIKKKDEYLRILAKEVYGCEYFITQSVYNAQATIDFLTRYAFECKARSLEPRRIILTFSPCGSVKTLALIEWLGISVPEATKLRILKADDPLKESLLINRNNFEQVIEACLPFGIPLGINIESLTHNKEETDAAILLFKLLKAMLDLKLVEQQL